MEYNNTQKSPLDELLLGLAAAAGVSPWLLRHEDVTLVLVLLAFAVFMAFAALSFGTLTISGASSSGLRNKGSG